MRKYLVVVKAALRLPASVILHQFGRLLRNRFARKFPHRYARYAFAPIASLREPLGFDRPNQKVIDLIDAFYRVSESTQDDACKGAFTFFGHRVDFGSIDTIVWDYKLPEENDHHLWRMKLTELPFVYSLLASNDPDRHQSAMSLIQSLDKFRSFAHPSAFKCAWAPYGVSHRMIALLGGLSRATAGSLDKEIFQGVCNFIRLDAHFLIRNIELDLMNNHTERNLAALCLYLQFVDAPAPSLVQRIDRYVKQIIEWTILPDGMQIERSAMYQAHSLLALTIFAETRHLSPATRALAETALVKAQQAWRILTHADGDIALFNDSWLGEVPRPMDLLPEAACGSEILTDAGYARLVKGPFLAIFDAGAIGPRWNPGHGHADFLSMELDVFGARFIVDPGTLQYSTGDRRSAERSAAFHNGPHLTGLEPVEYLGCFKVGSMVEAELIAMDFPNSVGGQLPLKSASLRRDLHIDEQSLSVKDHFSGFADQGAVHLHINAEWSILDFSQNRIVFERGQNRIALTVEEGLIEGCVTGSLSRFYMKSEVCHFITLRPERKDRDQSMNWSIQTQV